MIIECPYCESKVDAKEIAHHDSFAADDPAPFRATLVVCPSCDQPLLAGQNQDVFLSDNTVDWDTPRRVWPARDRFIAYDIPPIMRVSLEEAERCFKGRAYVACAVMSGRALEGACKHYGTASPTLARGLKELKDKAIIDARLYEWSESLRRHRNLGAHASTDKVSKEDARDLLDFAIAIGEYVFVLQARYEAFQARQAKVLAAVKPKPAKSSTKAGS